MLKTLLAKILIEDVIQDQGIDSKRIQLYHFNLPTAITILITMSTLSNVKKIHQNMTTWQLSQMLWRIRRSAGTFHILHMTVHKTSLQRAFVNMYLQSIKKII